MYYDPFYKMAQRLNDGPKVTKSVKSSGEHGGRG